MTALKTRSAKWNDQEEEDEEDEDDEEEKEVTKLL